MLLGSDWGFHTLRGSIDPGDLRFRPPVFGVVETWGDFWLHEPQPNNNQLVGLGFSQLTGKYRPRGSSSVSGLLEL